MKKLLMMASICALLPFAALAQPSLDVYACAWNGKPMMFSTFDQTLFERRIKWMKTIQKSCDQGYNFYSAAAAQNFIVNQILKGHKLFMIQKHGNVQEISF